MKLTLFTLFVFIVSTMLYEEIRGWCSIFPPTSQEPTHCQYKGYVFHLGEKREINCTSYSCGLDGSLGLCDNYLHIGGYPERCTVIQDGCKDKVVMKSDHNKNCLLKPDEVLTMLGR